MTHVLRCAVAAICLVLIGCDSRPDADQDAESPFDIVIQNGRVIDPETGLDAVRSVGVRADRIAAVSSEQLEGEIIIDATGKVVAPGFVDLHAHGQRILAARVQALDGVTTALELEGGVLPVGTFYDRAVEEGRPIHFGASVNWASARIAEKTV